MDNNSLIIPSNFLFEANNNDIDQFHLFLEYSFPKANTGRIISSIILKEIQNRFNIMKKY